MPLPWRPELVGGYKTPFDPRPAISRLTDKSTRRDAWQELWNELHHQGSLGDASYASIILLTEHFEAHPRDLDFYAFVSTIEVERHRKENPLLPEWFRDHYFQALSSAKRMALSDLQALKDPMAVHFAVALIAATTGQLETAAILVHFTPEELREPLDEVLGWNDLYLFRGRSV